MGLEFLRSCQRTHRESRALLARVRRGAIAVLASSVVLAPLLIASLSAAGRHLHSHDGLWLLALGAAALAILALTVAALFAVRCLTLSRSGTSSPPTAWGKRADPAQQGEILPERAQGNRQRAQLRIPLKANTFSAASRGRAGCHHAHHTRFCGDS